MRRQMKTLNRFHPQGAFLGRMPQYADVIIDRWEKFTGEKAVLLNDD